MLEGMYREIKLVWEWVGFVCKGGNLGGGNGSNGFLLLLCMMMADGGGFVGIGLGVWTR